MIVTRSGIIHSVVEQDSRVAADGDRIECRLPIRSDPCRRPHLSRVDRRIAANLNRTANHHRSNLVLGRTELRFGRVVVAQKPCMRRVMSASSRTAMVHNPEEIVARTGYVVRARVRLRHRRAVGRHVKIAERRERERRRRQKASASARPTEWGTSRWCRSSPLNRTGS